MQRSIRYEKDFDSGTCIIRFSDAEVLKLDLADVPESLHRALALHGLIQKVADATATSRGTSPTEKYGLALKAWDNLRSGNFVAERSKSPGEEPDEVLARAVSAVVGKDYDMVLTRIKGLSRSEKRELRAMPEVSQELDRIKGTVRRRPTEVLGFGPAQ